MTSIKSPNWLDTIGKAYWRRLVNLVELDNDSKREQLAMLCDNWSLFRLATKQLQDEGLTVVSGTGTSKPHPALSAKWQSQEQIRRLSKTLGIDDNTVKTIDDLEDLIGG
ncbi:MAG: P27 family phage terminase small subunit [Pirellulaceae bacterium]